MTKTQIEYLKLLGYEDTQEDGAILQHKEMGNDGFVWKLQRFDSVLINFRENYRRGHLKRVINRIIDEL